MNTHNIRNLQRHSRLDNSQSVAIFRPNAIQIKQSVFTPQSINAHRKINIIRASDIESDLIIEPTPTPAPIPKIEPQPQTEPAPAPAPKPKSKKQDKKQQGFINVLRFQVCEDVVSEFENIWQQRQEAMISMPGFVSFNIQKEKDDNVYVVRNEWATVQKWEDWSCSEVCRRTHLPVGVYQFVPKKGEGFPEDFVPFVDMNEAVNPKYK